MYTTGMFECREDVLFVFWCNLVVFDDDRKVWPAIKTLLDGRPVCAKEFKIEANW